MFGYVRAALLPDGFDPLNSTPEGGAVFFPNGVQGGAGDGKSIDLYMGTLQIPKEGVAQSNLMIASQGAGEPGG